jgi:hypothetical protein
VKDATTLLIIEGAQIEVLGTEFATESDALGEFVLELLPATYGIRVSMVDYTETELTGLVVVKGERDYCRGDAGSDGVVVGWLVVMRSSKKGYLMSLLYE